MRKKVNHVKDMGNYEVREETIDGTDYGTKDVIMYSAYNKAGHYIGDMKDAKKYDDMGILPELANPEHNTCSIGFCDKEQKWYGWSHRAYYGFGIGHIVKKGNGEASYGVIPEAVTDKERAIVRPIGFECKTIDDCKKCAIAFAASVS